MPVRFDAGTTRLATLADTRMWTKCFADHLRAGDVVALDGPLGAGKTTFVRCLVAALGGDEGMVASPTYTLMHVYESRPVVVHIDAYRLDGPPELEALGCCEIAADSIVCIEWARRVAPLTGLFPGRVWSLLWDHDGETARSVLMMGDESGFVVAEEGG